MAVVYQHRKAGTQEVFYIGIGKTIKRAYEFRNRNAVWNNIVKKYGVEVDILIDGIPREDAEIVEIGMIGSYGRMDLETGCLANLTYGGDGFSDVVRRPEWREKISKALKGKPKSPEHRARMHKYKKGDKHTDEWKLMMSEKMKGRKMKPEDVEKMRLSKYGSRNPSAKKVIDKSTWKVYGSVKEMCDELGLNYRAITRRLSGELKNTTPYLYYSEYNNKNNSSR